MQQLTAGPRSGYTAAQVTSLLQADALTVGYGLEILDGQDGFLADISDDLAAGEVDRDCTAAVHGTCKLSISRSLAWGAVRVRPYMTLSGVGLAKVRWNLGVYLLTTPEDVVGESPQTYAVTGYDKLYLLSQVIGTSYSVAAGSNVLAAVRALITASGAGGAVLLDGTKGANTLASDLVWPLDESHTPTYLEVINDLLLTIAYRPLWCDQDGAFRSDPYLDPATRPVEWTHDVTNPRTSLVGVSRSQTYDLFDVPNWWRFVQRGLDAPPSEGSGQYTVVNQSGGPNSIDTLGYTKRKVVYLDATDAPSLVSQGNQTVANDTLITRVLKVTTAPFPGAGHEDTVRYVDPALGGTVTCQVRAWTLDLAGGDMSQTWAVLS